MKSNTFRTLLATVGSTVSLLCLPASAQTLIAGYSFNFESANTDIILADENPIAADFGVQAGSASFDFSSLANDVFTNEGADEFINPTGTIVATTDPANPMFGVAPSEAAGFVAQISQEVADANPGVDTTGIVTEGKIVFASLDTTNFQDLNLLLAVTSGVNTFQDSTFVFSANGSAFQPILDGVGNPVLLPNDLGSFTDPIQFEEIALDLSADSRLNGVADLKIGLELGEFTEANGSVFPGGVSPVTTVLAIDNLQIYGTNNNPVTIPDFFPDATEPDPGSRWFKSDYFGWMYAYPSSWPSDTGSGWVYHTLLGDIFLFRKEGGDPGIFLNRPDTLNGNAHHFYTSSAVYSDFDPGNRFLFDFSLPGSGSWVFFFPEEGAEPGEIVRWFFRYDTTEWFSPQL